MLPRLRGAFSIVAMTKDRVLAFRDPHGLRPLAIGALGAQWRRTGAPLRSQRVVRVRHHRRAHLRDVRPGELVSIGEDGIRSRQVVEGARKAFCVFEYIYFARPDSRMNGPALQVARGRMGEILWREAPVEADLVIAVPDSGNPAARGLARAAGLPQDDGFVKNRYVARTFIQPGQELRKHGLRLKFNPLPEVIAGRRLIVVDDSIVRGNTTRQIVAMLRDAGAREVHMRISAPPIKHPCHYGIDMSTREEMIAHGRTTAEVAAESAATRCTTSRWRASTRRSAPTGGAKPTATPASAASTRSTGRTMPTASTRWSRPGRRCRSYAHSLRVSPGLESRHDWRP